MYSTIPGVMGRIDPLRPIGYSAGRKHHLSEASQMTTQNTLLQRQRIQKSAIERLLHTGAAVVPGVLSDGAIQQFCSHLTTLEWNACPESYGTRLVRQIYDHVSEFDRSGIFCRAAEELETRLEEVFNECTPNPYPRLLQFTDLRLQRYAPHSFGIEPHRDGDRYHGVVALLVIEDGGRLYTCKDHSKAGARLVDARRGDLILFSGNYFGDKNVQPCHFLEMGASQRVTFGLRQRVSKSSNECGPVKA